jgi:plasmid stabilization system protein ParE
MMMMCPPPYATSKITAAALRDLERLRAFLLKKNRAAAKRAGAAIIKSIQLLGQQPDIGTHVEGMEPEFRELPISFGANGYITRYHYADDVVTILALRHQKEAGY